MSWSYLVDWAWSFPHVNIDEEEGMKFDTGVDKSGIGIGLKMRKTDGRWPNLIGFDLSSIVGVWRKAC